MAIPKFDEWKKQTELGFTHPRSSQFKAIDQALETYWKSPGPGSQKNLRVALSEWIRWKGPGWRQSERNRPPRRIIEELHRALYEGQGPQLTAKDLEGLRMMDQSRRQAVQRLFLGKKLTLKTVDSAAEARKAYRQFKTAAEPLGYKGATNASAASAVQSMIGDMFDGETMAVVVPMLVQIFGEEIIASMVPFVSQIQSGARTVVAWGKAAKAKYTQSTTSHHGFVLGAGSPTAAFEAVIRLLERETSNQVRLAAIQSLDFTARVGTFFVDGGVASGPIIGAANAFAKLSNQIYNLGREYRETRAANRALANPNHLDFRLFTYSPLLGCYMICCSDDSDLLNMASLQFGMYGWMDEVENMKRNHLTPLRETAANLIRQSIYHIQGLTPRHRGGMVSRATPLTRGLA